MGDMYRDSKGERGWGYDPFAVTLAVERFGEEGFFDNAVLFTVLPVAEVAVVEGVGGEPDDPPLRCDLPVSNATHPCLQ